MTKSILIDRLCEACNVPPGRAEQILNAIFDSIEGALHRDERIEIRGFGSFEVRQYKGYVGRNPRTGDSVEVKPKRLPFFKVGKDLKDRVESGAVRDGHARAVAATATATAPIATTPSPTAERADTNAPGSTQGALQGHAPPAGPF